MQCLWKVSWPDASKNLKLFTLVKGSLLCLRKKKTAPQIPGRFPSRNQMVITVALSHGTPVEGLTFDHISRAKISVKKA